MIRIPSYPTQAEIVEDAANELLYGTRFKDAIEGIDRGDEGTVTIWLDQPCLADADAEYVYLVAKLEDWNLVIDAFDVEGQLQERVVSVNLDLSDFC
jgi:hypothetical protein